MKFVSNDKHSIKVVFPSNTGQRYYRVHFEYLKSIFEFAGLEIEYRAFSKKCELSVPCIINDRYVIFDISDNGESESHQNDIPVFKFHYKSDIDYSGVIYPFSPVSFDNWGYYFGMSDIIKYNRHMNTILCAQRPYGNAYNRRLHVRKLVQDKFNVRASSDVSNQLMYFKRAGGCIVSVHVPGQNNRMLDRGHLQLCMLGVCTISPNLPEILPFNNKLIPGIHYVECKEDYSDLIEKIEWCENNEDKCFEIGKNAKELTTECCTPYNLILWIRKCLGII